jgi:hypothetical protein
MIVILLIVLRYLSDSIGQIAAFASNKETWRSGSRFHKNKNIVILYHIFSLLILLHGLWIEIHKSEIVKNRKKSAEIFKRKRSELAKVNLTNLHSPF